MRIFKITIFCIGVLSVLSYYSLITEAAMRNLAFVSLADYFVYSEPTANIPPYNTIELFASLTKRNPSRYKPYYLRLQGIALSLADAEYNQYVLGRQALQFAQKAKTDGDLEQAEDHYRRAIEVGSEQVQVEARLHLANQLFLAGDLSGFEQYLSSVVEDTPPFPFRFDQCPDQELLGGYVDEHDIKLSLPVHIVLVWKTDPGLLQKPADAFLGGENSIASQWQTIAGQNYLFQIGVADNLMYDGGFERVVLPYSGIPQGFESFATDEYLNSAVTYDDPIQSVEMILTLNGISDGIYVGLQSKPAFIPRHSSGVGYLLVGRYRSDDNANVRIGIRWLLIDAEFNDNISSYAVMNKSASEWTQFARLAIPPEDAEKAQLWIIELNGLASLYVDDLALFRIHLPCARQQSVGQ